MCNAANHSRYCPSGFGGNTGGGGGRRGRGYSSFVVTIEPASARWVDDTRGTVESYIYPTSCPECGAAVWFYRSPMHRPSSRTLSGGTTGRHPARIEPAGAMKGGFCFIRLTPARATSASLFLGVAAIGSWNSISPEARRLIARALFSCANSLESRIFLRAGRLMKYYATAPGCLQPGPRRAVRSQKTAALFQWFEWLPALDRVAHRLLVALHI
jgi:hypothetical protein